MYRTVLTTLPVLWSTNFLDMVLLASNAGNHDFGEVRITVWTKALLRHLSHRHQWLDVHYMYHNLIWEGSV